MTGTVKWFNEQKGIGYIDSEDGSGRNILVQYQDISSKSRNLSEGQRVSFEVINGPKGPQASSVEVIS